MTTIVEELSTRWQKMFTALKRGDDLPPGARLRAEGLMEAAEMLGVATAGELQTLMAGHYEAIFGYSLAEEFGEDWADFFEFPQIPAVTSRAPVYPSTRD